MKSSNDSRPFRFAEQSCYLYAGVVLAACALLLQGCAQKQVRVRPWATAIAVRPHLTHPVQATLPDLTEVDAPELSVDLPPLPSPLTISRQPARPRVAVQQTPEAAESRKPAAPLFFLPEAPHDFVTNAKAAEVSPGSHFLGDIVIATMPGASRPLLHCAGPWLPSILIYRSFRFGL